MLLDTEAFVIDANAISDAFEASTAIDAVHLRDILDKALELHGLEPDDVAALAAVDAPALLDELFHAANTVKETIYGRRLVLFAPLYVSNFCSNECLYCAFRARNQEVKRRALTQAEIETEVRTLVQEGHKRILLVAGEQYPDGDFGYILDAIDTIYRTKSGKGEIRRVNVNIAPLETEEFRQLKARGIGTYQLFQETYHPETYRRVHLAGKKRDYLWRLTVMDRAMEAGIDDVGIGVLFGLHDWRFEVLAMLQHIRHLEEAHGVGPHTISVPRIEPATGSDLSGCPPAPVSDLDFKKIIAILRLTVPYTGIILSTRETAEMRRAGFALGVSQISAGSRTNPGGYSEHSRAPDLSQFSLGDHRSLDEVIRDVAGLGYIPSFCTACYRLGRTGQDFMDMAKTGLIKYHCDPNALSTFTEYLEDYASPETRAVGEQLIENVLNDMDARQRRTAAKLIARIKAGERDAYI
jgi:2-iminoacetate synthase